MSISPSLSPRQCPRSLRLSCRSELTRQRISLPLDRYSYGRRFTRASVASSTRHQFTNFLNLQALGRRQPPYMVLRLCGDLCFC
ncbi:hypothetical protein LUZ62_006089 [Rhynchospora pubera]|uniref:Uncharacterized protein n=1 Tax=Rhynchospora pubera TaxID=906938 RepID=A0AAV8B700_9POAL|nr:hypothetical protein LUZ62_006089 [Rhynchospora pubera]